MGSPRFTSAGRSRGIVPTARRHPPGPPAPVERFALSALRIMFGVGVTFAVLDLIIAVAARDGAAQIAVGVGSSAAWISGLVWFGRTSQFVRRAGGVAALVAVLSGAVAFAGTWSSPFTSEVFALMGVATVVESKRGVAACVAVAATGYVAGLLTDGLTLSQLTDSRHAAVVANNIGDFVLFAGVLLVAFGACWRVLGSAPEILASVRGGGLAITPDLGVALRRADSAPVASLSRPPAADVVAVLSERERALMRELASGLAPKQIAHDSGTPLGTIRSQIASAKRKTGARTVEQLVGLVAEADRTA